MGIRVTEISTPFGGVAWEYTDKPEAPALPSLQPGRKIEVFISSICGDNGKYDRVRAELKKPSKKPVWRMCICSRGREPHLCRLVPIMNLHWLTVISAYS